MKKLGQGIFRLFLIGALTITFLNPLTIKADNADSTIADLKADLEALQKRKQENDNKKQMTQSEINAAKDRISAAMLEKEQIEKDVEEAKLKVEDSEKQIAELKKETEALLRYFQLAKGDDVYSEFLSDATSLKDLIRRLSAVEQITDYTNNALDRLDALIIENEKLQEDLKVKEEELSKSIEKTEKELKTLEGHLDELGEVNVDINDEIRSLQSDINYYKQICPDENTPVYKCAGIASADGWLKPLTKGYITSTWGGRIDPITGKPNNFHYAVDIGGNPEGTTVYSATPGQVSMIIYKSNCGGNQVFVQSIVKGQKYTIQYGHLLNISVQEHQVVTTDTVIGHTGGGSTSTLRGGYDQCTTGTHLHFGVSKGFYPGEVKTWSGFIANNINPPGFPGLYSWFYGRGDKA